MPAEPRPAATVLLLRDGPEGPEVWLTERARGMAFMASAWVFPGGRVDPADAEVAVIPPAKEPAAPFWVAALRELEEEAGVRLAGEPQAAVGRLKPWARWVTPEIEPRRYDTFFFAARLPEGAEPRVDGGEAVRGGWFTAPRAIGLCQAGELPVAPPTLRTLYELAAFRDVAGVLAAERALFPILPRFQDGGDGVLHVLLPGDPDHPSPHRVDPPYRYVFQAGRWWAR